MKKIIFVLCLMMIVPIFGCELYYGTGKVEEIYDYDFENDINFDNFQDYFIWIKNNIKYDNNDIYDYAQIPEETYLRKKGDCEDMCLLLAYFLDKKGYYVNIVVGISNQNSSNHVMIKIEENYYEANNSTIANYYINKNDCEDCTNPYIFYPKYELSYYKALGFTLKYHDF